MSRRLPAHFGRALVLPPRDLIDPLVETTPLHWYWLGEFHDDNIDRTAVFPWAPPAEHTTEFVVARLLWCWANNGVGIKRLILKNTCGLGTCINPDHWRYANSPVKAVYTLVPDAPARLLSYQRPPHTTHIVPSETGYAMCGVWAAGLVVSEHNVITCEDCASEWQSYGRPLLEVKPP